MGIHLRATGRHLPYGITVSHRVKLGKTVWRFYPPTLDHTCHPTQVNAPRIHAYCTVKHNMQSKFCSNYYMTHCSCQPQFWWVQWQRKNFFMHIKEIKCDTMQYGTIYTIWASILGKFCSTVNSVTPKISQRSA